MAKANIFSARKRYAVVTGSYNGIGYEICKQLALNGVTVVLTARDEKKGAEAVKKLNDFGLSDYVVFHQLDVTNPSSVASLANFVKTRFGVLDILVNNAAIIGVVADWKAIEDFFTNSSGVSQSSIKLKNHMVHSDGTPKECLETNYYGAKMMVEAFVPLLQLSDSPRIVNITSTAGLIERIPGKEVKAVLSNAESLTEERVDELLSEFLKDFKEGSLQTKGWPTFLSAYTMPKAALNAYTRVLAKKYPSFRVNCVCPGYVKTDITENTGWYTAQEGAEGPVKVALLPDDGPSGLIFQRNEVSSY